MELVLDPLDLVPLVLVPLDGLEDLGLERVDQGLGLLDLVVGLGVSVLVVELVLERSYPSGNYLVSWHFL